MAHDERRSRTGSRFRMVLLVIEGHAYLLGTVLFFVGLMAWLAWGVLTLDPVVAVIVLFVGVPLTLLIVSAIRALIFQVPEPSGVEVTAADAPALHAMIEEVRTALGAPRVHRVIVGNRFNASATQIARPGLPWPRNIVVLGYPVLTALSPEQIKAVVAHELAHLFHAHGRLSGWVYRTLLSWRRLAAALDDKGTMPIFVRWILWYYVPRLRAHAAVLSREHELHADAATVRLMGSRCVAETLVAFEIGDHLVSEKYWPSVNDSVEHLAELPLPFAAMAQEIDRLFAQAATAEILASRLERATAPHDSHPSLRERLQAIGETARVPERPALKAGEQYLGAHLQTVAARLDEDWQHHRREDWTRDHAEISGNKRRLAELEALAATGDAAYERGRLLEKLDREEEALQAYRQALELDPTHARAAVAAGRILVDRDDGSAVELLQHAMKADPGQVSEACALLEFFYDNRGQPSEALRYRTQGARHKTRSGLAAEERSRASALDRLAPHGLPASEVQGLAAAIASIPDMAEALLVRKELRYSEGSLLLLGLVPRRPDTGDLGSRVRHLQRLPEDSQIVVLDRDNLALRAALEAIDGSRLPLRAA